MPAVPNNLSLDNIANGAEIKAQPLRDNYTDIQTEFNKVVAILDGGTSGQLLTNQGSGNVDWANAPAATAVPTGAVTAYAGASAPAGWLLCDGSAVSRTTYADLFTAIGTAYGAGDGSTTFNLPDTRGRVQVGKGSNASVDTLGENEGVTETNRRPQHRHTPHTHTVPVADNPVGGGNRQAGNNTVSTSTTSSVDGGSGNANDSLDAPAYLVFNFIIKT
jgi:microcystin-dependent protein